MCKISSLCSMHSQKLFEYLRTIYRECTTSLRFWNCKLPVHMGISFWIATDTLTKYSNDEKTHSARNSKMFRRFKHMTDQLYEVELVKTEIEHREPIIVFVLQYAKQRMLELYFLQKVLWRRQVIPLLGCRKKTWKTLFSIKSKTSGMRCVPETAQTLSLPTQQKISFPEFVAIHKKNMRTRSL